MLATTRPRWALFDLEVVTPRLVLRYVSDDLGAALATLAAAGIHDPATMPFTEPWTDVPSPHLERNSLQYYWRNRAETSVQRWNLDLAVLVDGSVVGMCSIHAEGFPGNRRLTTGSWLGLAHQGRGPRQGAPPGGSASDLRRLRRRSRHNQSVA